MPVKHHCKNTFDFNFDDPPEVKTLEGGSPTSLSDFDMKLRSTLKKCVDLAGKRDNDALDRIEIAARMSRLLGREITKANIDQWIAMSTVERRIHADALKALCEIIGDWQPLETFVEACGFKLLSPEEAKAAEYGATMLMKEMIDGDVKRIKGEINHSILQRDLQKRIAEGNK